MGRQGARRAGRGGIDRRIAFIVIMGALLLGIIALVLFMRPTGSAGGGPATTLRPDTVEGCADALTEALRSEEEIGGTPPECDGLTEQQQHEAGGVAFSRVATEEFEKEMAKLENQPLP